MNNYRVVLYEKNYPAVGGIATLIGVYGSYRAAAFISNAVKKKFNLSFTPPIEPTTYSVTTDSVDDFLRREDDKAAAKTTSKQVQNSEKN